MKLIYRITRGVKDAIDKFEWIKSNYHIGQLGDFDERELTRLLDNTHYPHIEKLLNFINTYGSASGEIGKELLTCNDNLNLPRTLSELYLFSHIQNNVHFSISSIHPTRPNINTDFLVTNSDTNIYIEVYTPMDFYGFQYFFINLMSLLKYLPIDIGYAIQIRGCSSNLYHAYEFPTEFREIDKWLYQFQDSIIIWLNDSAVGDTFKISSPNKAVELSFLLKYLFPNYDERLITNGEPTRSSDTRLFFENQNAQTMAKSQWGLKIFNKMNKQQAGYPDKDIIRILLINFMLSDTADTSFLNEQRYSDNINRLVTHLAKQIEPYPPYDIVIPCNLGLECGFAHPIILSDHSPSFVNQILSNTSFNKPIPPVPVATEKESEIFIKEIF